MKQGGKRAIGFYLIDKVVRLVFVVFLIIVYALADCSSLLAFSMSLLAFYLVSMVTSIIFYVKVEQNLETFCSMASSSRSALETASS